MKFSFFCREKNILCCPVGNLKEKITFAAQIKAQMAELVDALDSKSGSRKGVGVRFPLWAHDYQQVIKVVLYTAFVFSKFASKFASKNKFREIKN